MSRRFRNLTPAQSAEFERVAVGGDAFGANRTREALQKKGLFESRVVTLPAQPGQPAWTAIQVRRYDVPLPVHMEWCAWCADNCEEAV